MQCVKVAVSDATPYYDKLYTYQIPAALEGQVFAGSWVLVPFGRGKARPRQAVVIQMETGEKPMRSIKQLLSAAPIQAALSAELLFLVSYLKENTFCTWFEAVKTIIPFGAKYKIVNNADDLALQPEMKKQMETVYTLARALPENWQEAKMLRLTEKQYAVLQFISASSYSYPQVAKACAVGRGVLQSLVKKAWLLQDSRNAETFYSPLVTAGPEENQYLHTPAQPLHLAMPVQLSAEQQQVVATLLGQMQGRPEKPALLYGVTGSGKTQVFMALAQKVLQQGKTVLVLVPEIGLTPQMMDKMRGAFGSLVAIQHSALSAGQRLAQWQGIQAGKARLVVGTRSAVFAPLENMGLIVVDEEHERSYQSETAPRYDAIDLARQRAARHGALLLLASATPSVGSYFAAQQGRYSLASLSRRYGSLPLPSVQLVDMGEEILAGNQGSISQKLAQDMCQTLNEDGQVILLLNRRGYHRVAVCKSCKKPVTCGECSVAMVFHREKAQEVGRLLCHQCGRSASPAPVLCPSCGMQLQFLGFGTQRLEEELAQILPNARILRMDYDTTKRKGEHANILQRFASGGYDVLLGTQMVAKGLDFKRVRLVGVVGIDSLMFAQDYRAQERVFSLVTQVVGRSGRFGSQGKAIIQTVDVQNPVLRLAAQQNYTAFYEDEIAFRKLMLYPPYCSMCMVGFAAKAEADSLAAAKAFAKMLAQQAAKNPEIPLRILGPAPMNVAQAAGKYRHRISIKCRGDKAFRALVRSAMQEYYVNAWPAKAKLWIDFFGEG